jgi:LacI family transcriptional regulator
MTSPPLSTVKVPLFDMGQLAAKKVLHLISKDSEEASTIRLPVTLIERASSLISRS